MNYSIKQFDESRIDEAAQLLLDYQNKHMDLWGKDLLIDIDLSKNIIEKKLKQNVSTALMLFDNDKVVAYMIALIRDDKDRGPSGWIDLGCWAVSEGYEDSIPYLYQKVAEDWMSQKILCHYFFIFEEDNESRAQIYDLSFAKEQVHGILPLANIDLDNNIADDNEIEVRMAREEDREQLKSFSRIIPNHQVQSPCFASAPLGYLKSLDEGFSELLDDDEGEVYIAIKDKEAYGIAIFYEEEKDLIIPENASELCVGSVKEEARGLKIGLKMTMKTFQDQLEKGRKYIVSDWRCANLLSSRFWPSIGFKPTAVRYVRRLDPVLLEE